MSDAPAALRLTGVWRGYREGAGRLEVLRGADLAIAGGEIVALVAPSGAGKTTLLQIAGLLDTPDSGAVAIGGRAAAGLDDRARTALRRAAIGFVYQFHHLLPEFTALENVALPLLVAGRPVAAARERAGDLLARIGLGERLLHKPGELSGGERQRVAVARALANDPACVLADEPTGNLDRDSARQVLELMLALNDSAGATLVIVTHDAELAGRMARVLVLGEGRLAESPLPPSSPAL